MTSTRRHFFAMAAVPLLPGRLMAEPGGKRIRIGQVGTQHGHAAGKMEALRRLNEHFEVAGVAGVDPNPGVAFNGIPRMELAALLALPDL